MYIQFIYMTVELGGMPNVCMKNIKYQCYIMFNIDIITARRDIHSDVGIRDVLQNAEAQGCGVGQDDSYAALGQ